MNAALTAIVADTADLVAKWPRATRYHPPTGHSWAPWRPGGAVRDAIALTGLRPRPRSA